MTTIYTITSEEGVQVLVTTELSKLVEVVNNLVSIIKKEFQEDECDPIEDYLEYFFEEKEFYVYALKMNKEYDRYNYETLKYDEYMDLVGDLIESVPEKKSDSVSDQEQEQEQEQELIEESNNKEIFCENPNVLEFLKDIFKAEYSKELAPKWVNFDMFEQEMIRKMSENLYESIMEASFTTTWNSMLHVPYISKSCDPESDFLWDYFDEFEVKIPDNIVKLALKKKYKQEQKVFRIVKN
jgi:hypothetical protein